MEKDGMTVNADVFEKLSDAIMFSDENFKKFIKNNGSYCLVGQL